jgi:hypothetical protein
MKISNLHFFVKIKFIINLQFFHIIQSLLVNNFLQKSINQFTKYHIF